MATAGRFIPATTVATHRTTRPIVNFASVCEDNVIEQATNIASLPFVHPHVALMPDAHFGKGTAVGTVFGTQGAIIPSAVGVDIGCGMIAVRTGFTTDDLKDKDLVVLRDAIEAAIPLSPGRYNAKVIRESARGRVEELFTLADNTGVNLRHSPKWMHQLGSLGGGNHFIELTVDELQRVWMFLHSGSRGVGNLIARTHIKAAAKQCKKNFVDLPDPDLAFLVEGTEEFDRYIAELNWAQRFAFLNREEMMDRFAECLADFMGTGIDEQERINCHHNYTVKERHYGRDVWLTRKGAIFAGEGAPGLIPGSMGTASYVVRGKADKSALCSAPHGAGRVMSRREAQKRFTEEDLANRMGGIVYRPGKEFVDEIPDAYKDIDAVMTDAADLVEIRHTLRQVLNVKGQ